MNETIHEPEIVSDAKNAVGYFIVLCFVTAGTILLFAGAVSPIFLPKMLESAKKKALEGKEGTYETRLKKYRNEAILRVVVWFILAWAILFMAYYPVLAHKPLIDPEGNFMRWVDGLPPK